MEQSPFADQTARVRPVRSLLDPIWQTFSGDAAWQAVADLSRFHRIQASPGHRAAAGWLHGQLARAGLEAQILSYPADRHTTFWAFPSFREWDCSEATLRLVEPQDEATVLADFRACPISLIQRSAPFEGEAEVVVLADGEEESEYEGLDLAGKVVLTRGGLRRVHELAVVQRGAAGILFDGMRVVLPVRPEGDLADARQYTSFWWKGDEERAFGFVLTPRQGAALRRLLKEAKGPVRIRARVDSRFYDGAIEVVTAVLPGQGEQEVVVVAHLCHPSPSANDNASGAAAALEAARTLHALVARGDLPRPRRTIRFLWLPEMTGSAAYLAGREAELGHIVAGVNLDMVGEDQDQTGSAWLIERPPEAAASFAPDLLACLRDQMPSLKTMPGVARSHANTGGYLLYRLAEEAFSGGSDHYIFADPSVGVPMPTLIQWPDRFYHTSADTPDRTDPRSLARAGTLAAAYAYWLASAAAPEATWLGYEMVARFKARLAQEAQAAVTAAVALDRGGAPDGGNALATLAGDLDRRLAYLLERQKAALRSLERLGPVQCLAVDLLAEAERAAMQELAWARGAIDLHAARLGLAGPAALPQRQRSAQELEAAELVPVRRVRGPIPLSDHLDRLDAAERQAWRELVKGRQERAAHTLLDLALYWADGKRAVLEIAGLVELETGQRDVELLLAYFRLLGRLGFVALERAS